MDSEYATDPQQREVEREIVSQRIFLVLKIHSFDFKGANELFTIHFLIC